MSSFFTFAVIKATPKILKQLLKNDAWEHFRVRHDHCSQRSQAHLKSTPFALGNLRVTTTPKNWQTFNFKGSYKSSGSNGQKNVLLRVCVLYLYSSYKTRECTLAAFLKCKFLKILESFKSQASICRNNLRFWRVVANFICSALVEEKIDSICF